MASRRVPGIEASPRRRGGDDHGNDTNCSVAHGRRDGPGGRRDRGAGGPGVGAWNEDAAAPVGFVAPLAGTLGASRALRGRVSA